MRVLFYSRVSTLAQETDGESLRNQSRAFDKALERNPAWICVRRYQEAASAKTMAGRAEFSRMIAELPETRPDMIVVDSIDRWTRNLREGLTLLEEFRGRHVRLLPLDWRRTEPINMDDDRDWQDVVQEFVAAERENRGRARRMRRSWEGRRERGATLANRTFGLIKQKDRFVPGPDAWVIAEVDRRYLAGDSMEDLLVFARSVSVTKSWTCASGMHKGFRSKEYVAAGVRTPETAAALDAMLKMNSIRMAQRRKHDHEFTGVFACGRCIALGVPAHKALMGGQTAQPTVKSPLQHVLVCQSARTLSIRHKPFCVRVRLIAHAWHAALEQLEVDDEVGRRWQRAGASVDAEQKRRALLRKIGALDGDASRLKVRRDRAFDLLDENDSAIAAQARKMLVGVDADEAALAVKGELLRAQIAALGEQPKPRDLAWLRDALRVYRAHYGAMTIRQRNLANRKLCAAIGSHPVINREGDSRWSPPVVTWPEVIASPLGTALETTGRPRSTRGKA